MLGVTLLAPTELIAGVTHTHAICYRSMEQQAAAVEALSSHNRAQLAAGAGLLSTAMAQQHSTDITTVAGAYVPRRLAQPLLAEFCARLPGADRCVAGVRGCRVGTVVGTGDSQ